MPLVDQLLVTHFWFYFRNNLPERHVVCVHFESFVGLCCLSFTSAWHFSEGLEFFFLFNKISKECIQGMNEDKKRAHRELRSSLFVIQNVSGVSPALDEKRVTCFEWDRVRERENKTVITETTLKIVTCTYSMCEGPVVCQFYVHVFFELMKSDWKYENHFRMSASHLSGLMEFIFATQIERLKLNDASTSAILARCRCGILPLLSCYCIQVCCFRRCLSLHILRFW
jgi:hypothetical protein